MFPAEIGAQHLVESHLHTHTQNASKRPISRCVNASVGRMTNSPIRHFLKQKLSGQTVQPDFRYAMHIKQVLKLGLKPLIPGKRTTDQHLKCGSRGRATAKFYQLLSDFFIGTKLVKNDCATVYLISGQQLKIFLTYSYETYNKASQLVQSLLNPN